MLHKQALMTFGLTLAMLCYAPEWSVAQNTKWTQYGMVSVSCGTLTKAERDERTALLSWSMGFLSGVSWANASMKVQLRETDYDGGSAWIEKYCRERPLTPEIT